MEKGTVKFFNESKGFGFITQSNQKDIFVHASGLLSENGIKEGDTVEFDIQQGKKGLVAVNVSVTGNN